MRTRILTLIAALAATISLTVAAAPTANAYTMLSGRNVTLSNGDTVTTYVNWDCGTAGTQERPIAINVSNMDAGKTYVLYGDQAVNGTLVHRESVTAVAPQGGAGYSGLWEPRAPADINMVIKTTGGTTLGHVRHPGC